MIVTSACWFPGGSYLTANVKEYNEYTRHLKKFPLYEIIVYKGLTVVGLANDGKRGIVADRYICGEYVMVLPTKNEKPRPRNIEAAGYGILCEGLLNHLALIPHHHVVHLIDNINYKLPGLRDASKI